MHRDSPRADSAKKSSVARDSAAKPRRRRDSTVVDSARRKSVVPNPATAPTAGRFTIQVAAYDTRQSAEQLVTRLGARGIVARLVPSTTPPYRVRIGRYASDAAATVAARELKDKGIVGFVTTTDNESAPAPVRR